MKLGNKLNPQGLWLIDKPLGISSFGVIARLRRELNEKKIGHAGTLDPLASGLLLVLVGKEFTKQAAGLVKQDKTYVLQITLGATTITDDAEGDLQPVSNHRPSLKQVQACLKTLTGEIEQTPPIYSAIKISGKPAYKLARSGKSPVMPSRPVIVYQWTNIKYDYPIIEAEVRVSSGTYIRSLARTIGNNLQTGAYLSALRRTSVGEYSIEQAIALDNIV